MIALLHNGVGGGRSFEIGPSVSILVGWLTRACTSAVERRTRTSPVGVAINGLRCIIEVQVCVCAQ